MRPPFCGILNWNAAVWWIMFGTGTDKSFILKLCWIGAGRIPVVVIDIVSSL